MSAAGLDFHPVAKYHPTEPKGLFKLPVHYVQNIQYTVDVKVFKSGKKKKKSFTSLHTGPHPPFPQTPPIKHCS